MPASLKTRVNLLLLIVWWASISVLGFWVVPMLFASLPTPAEAGRLAARLFAQQGWIALVCGIGLVAFPWFVSNAWLMVLVGAVLMAIPRFIRL